VTMALLARHPSIRFNRVVLIASVNRLSDMMALFRQRMRLSESVDRAFFGHALRLVKQPLEIFDVENIARQRGEAALIIHDRDDEIVPCSSGQAIAQAWPGAQYHETQKLGHRRILKNDAVIQLVSDFMSVK
jgi:pimeloyl-ACP methyl ester carboxylesterase